MGAYGSPDLNEQKPKPQPFQPPVYQSPNYYQSPYQQQPQPPKQADSNNYQCPYMQAYLELRDQHVTQQPPQEKRHGCLLAIIVALSLFVGFWFGVIYCYNNANGIHNAQSGNSSYSTYK